jgi:hypothetical protein
MMSSIPTIKGITRPLKKAIANQKIIEKYKPIASCGGGVVYFLVMSNVVRTPSVPEQIQPIKLTTGTP